MRKKLVKGSQVAAVLAFPLVALVGYAVLMGGRRLWEKSREKEEARRLEHAHHGRTA